MGIDSHALARSAVRRLPALSLRRATPLPLRGPTYHFRRFAAESQRTGEYVRALGGERLFGGIAGPEICADEDWDLVLLIRYPNFAAVHQTLTEESIGSFVSQLREETIERSRFIVATELAQ